MLEQMRKSSQSLLIYILFGIVIAVFIVNFGPQSGGGCDPGGDVDNVAAQVGGRVLTTNNFRYGYMMLGGGQFPAAVAKQRRVKETVMDKLIERELFAEEALRLGFRISDEEVEDLIFEAKMIGLGYPRMVPRVQKDGKFDYELFRNFVRFELGLNPKTFIEEQRRELLAFRVRELLRDSVKVSPAEVKADFERKGLQVNLEYVRFAPRRYEAEIEPTESEISAYAAANEKKLKETYDQRKFLYEKAPKELRLRHLVIKVDAVASADTDAAAKKKAEALLARAKKGEALAKLAREASEDDETKARGGTLGWRRKGATGLGGPVEEAVFAGKEGEIMGPVKGDAGWHLVVAEGSREGDIPFDKVRAELAEEQLRQDKAKARARADAEAAMAKARGAAGKTLKDLFPTAPDGEGAADGGKGKTGASAFSDAPRAEETGLFSRRGAVVEGIGVSNDLAKAVFEMKPDAPLGGPYDVSGSWVVLRLKERKEPDMAELEKKKDELARDAELTKWEQVMTAWADRLCTEAKEAKRLDVNRDVLRYDEGPEASVAYEPCSPLSSRM